MSTACHLPDFTSFTLMLLWMVCGFKAYIVQSRLARRLMLAEPGLWQELGTWHRWNENSEMHESAVMSYVLQSMHRSLSDSVLVALGDQCRRWYLAMFILFAVWIVTQGLLGGSLLLSCAWRSQ